MVLLINFAAWLLFAFSLAPFEHKFTGQLANISIVCAIAAICAFAAAGSTYWLAQRIENVPPRILIDKATGREIKVRKSAGSLFFIPVRYWPYLTLALWVLLALGAIQGGDLMAQASSV
jgi:hypothetical protein